MTKRTIRKNRAFTAVELMIVVLIMANLFAIALPQFIQARASSRLGAILMNLKAIEQAKGQCVMEKGLKNGDTAGCQKANLTNATTGYLKGQWPQDSPVTGAYAPQAVGTDATFRGKDADWWRANKNHSILR